MVMSAMTLMRAVVILLIVCVLDDRVSAQTSECRIGKSQQVAELMFGRKIGERIGVSNTAWARFVDREITPRFPNGFTVVDAQGQWRDTDHNKVMREPSKLVQIVLPGTDEDQQRLGEIAAAYKVRFRQQSVGIIVRPACVGF
jgi:Protein of unknown function (DUF3574)